MPNTDAKPTVGKVRKMPGIAGSYAYEAEVTYPGEGKSIVIFHGSVYGGRVVMKTSRIETFVSQDVMQRCGAMLDEKWVRKFFDA
jgi:hypothetical protein